MVRSHDNRVLANRIACTTGLVRSYTAVRAGLLMSAYGGAVVVKCRQSHKLAEIVETDRSEDLDVGLGIPELSAVPSAVAVGARARAENHTSTHTHTHSLHAHSADHPFQQAPVHVGVECGEGGTWDERGHELVEVGERTDRSILPVPTEFTDSLSPRNGNSGHGSAVPERNSDRNTYTSRGAEINRDVNRDEPALLTMAELEIEQGIDWGADERPTAGTVESAYSHASTPSAHTHTEHGVDGLNGPPTYMGEGADGGVYAHTDVRHTGTSQALQTHRLEDGEIRNDIERHAVSADGCTHTPPTQGLNEWVHEEGIDWEGSLERERGGSSPHTRTHEDLYANAVGDKYADTHADTYASAHAQADRRVGSGYASLDTHTQTHKLTKAQKRNMAAAEKEMTQHHTDAYNSTGNRSNEGNQHHANNQTENTQYLDYVEQAFYAATHPDQMLQVLEVVLDVTVRRT
ncbi:hypothetical protein SARC_15104 [Sphaeroforma arctica JP610]|uniref:Uncharacterized protein n=1 Tax=Sphaeroforma arctica JP610 TaxID=667725 RepID=A0A0L0F6H8_9EUKA|nr:hypothetical protein SARC_15104 [Sphaeroforma arctica JP610]KNC72342.1 hypothetical protein SARC_15104 [Sphaeroforma arctica JP610]|eukprot:XP_014146244.1 hypothetical protein SARC_15104 [Sphaeroforma arctica JP610]